MTEPKLLSGGNPQIPKGDGDGPVQAYIAAMPGWKRGVGEAIDRIVAQVAPDASKAVKWNTPFYGTAPGEWFLAFHCFERYVKVTFFKGTALDPVPPETSKQADVRYAHIHEDGFDEAAFAEWVRQASVLPGARV